MREGGDEEKEKRKTIRGGEEERKKKRGERERVTSVMICTYTWPSPALASIL